jgi:hypothetical protein
VAVPIERREIEATTWLRAAQATQEVIDRSVVSREIKRFEGEIWRMTSIELSRFGRGATGPRGA